MADDDHQGDAVDPLELIRRHVRSIRNALAAIDQTHPAAGVVTSRMQGTLDVLLYDVDELRYFLNNRKGEA